jgi:4-hydroxybenzoate polyprenyltransferase
MLRFDGSPVRGATPRWSLRREVAITVRLNADNVWVASLPPLLFTLTAALRFELSGFDLAVALLQGLVWSLLFIYVFDTANQAGGSQEDHTNKPYRPIPSGLVTPEGMWRRSYVSSAIFVALSAFLSPVTCISAIVWVATVQVTHHLLRPHHYRFWKPVTTWVGAIAQLAGAWAIAHPLDDVGWYWTVVIATMFIIPLPIEDVRDMAGDEQSGRVTYPLRYGAAPVRRWFVVMMAVWPVVAYLLLFQGSGASSAAALTAAALMAALCWPTAVLTGVRDTYSRNRLAYKLYSFVHVVLVGCAVLLLS